LYTKQSRFLPGDPGHPRARAVIHTKQQSQSENSRIVFVVHLGIEVDDAIETAPKISI
jgi:hypothetical protein